MAVSEAESRVMNPKAPLTPPSERMDLDLEHPHGVSLPNGHPSKEPSLNSDLSLDHSTYQDPPTDNIKPYLENSAISPEGALEASQESTYTSHQPASSEPELHSSAFTSSAPDDIVEQSKPSLEDSHVDNVSVIEASASIVQAPTSDLREELQLAASSEPFARPEEPNLKQVLAHDSDLVDVLPSGGPETTGEPTTPTKAAIAEQKQAETTPPPAEGQMDTSQPHPESVTVTTTDLPHHPPVPSPDGAQPELPIDPAPSPAALTESPSQAPAQPQTSNIIDLPSKPPLPPVSPPTNTPQQPSDDQVMQDVPASPAKLVRPREDDDVASEPAAKRSKTEVDASAPSEFKKPDLPDITTNVNGVQPHTRADFANPPTGTQSKAILRLLSNIKRTRDAASFVAPVDHVALNIPSYPTVITQPMDLGTLEQKFKDHQYPSISAFISDFDLIIQNCEMFNGLNHAVTLSAHKMKASFDKQIEKLPGPEAPEHGAADKKKKPSVSAMDKPAAIRRESRSSLPVIARSPITPASPQTFALNPQGMPLIRRDSAAEGRPKREIHPPAPRDLPYSNQKPKKKKYLGELKFCEYVLSELRDKRYTYQAQFFTSPVDPVALNIPDYHKIIKRPMDLGTIGTKLSNGEYENAKEFEADVRLVFTNCYKFNPQDHPVHQAGKTLEGAFDNTMAKKNSWIENNVPLSGPTSPGSSPEASDDDADDEEDEDEQSSLEIRKLQEQIAAMSKQVELITQKKKSPPAVNKKSTKAAVKPEKKPKKAAPVLQPKAKSTAKSASKKARYVSYEEKQDISNRINDLSEQKMAQALNIIRNNMPGLKDSQGDELELDIDELGNEVLIELHKFVKRHAPRPEDKAEKASPPAYTPVASTGPSRKKNKPMGKNEQESKIKQLESMSAKFNTSGTVERSIEYPAVPDATTAQDRDTSGDEDDSEESEEE